MHDHSQICLQFENGEGLRYGGYLKLNEQSWTIDKW
jgi:hypothetical protein